MSSRRPDPKEREDLPGPPEEPVVLPIEDSLDLHPFAPRDIPDVVAST